ncbi:MAG: ribonuclease E/G, partial [Planctomycetota bacterium]
MKKEMLVNVLQPEETRIAIVEDGRLEELYLERSSGENLVGNIYKGKVVNVEPSIQACFVDFGEGRNGFLHVSDIEYQYFKHLRPDGDPDDDFDNRRGRGGRNEKRQSKPQIQEILRRGSEVLVQVIKEGLGNKGPTLSTKISVPGRYLVLMPSLGRVGVSRKIEDDDERRELRRMLRDMSPPKGVGFIVRTAALDRSQSDLKNDLTYLTKLWQSIAEKVENASGVCTVYEETDIMIRTIRDTFNADIDAVHIDSEDAFNRAKAF